ncbi:DNA polymerase III subunit alpha [Fictibacillus iocasae]|uniref:DNA polymerase III subunit alpha n=1 Tax=Fictibacillus iocasae TaxID=2715437 RepID=A0ABW2NU37_9BACL
MFVPLHIHTEYSLLESSCRLKNLVERASELGFSSLAVTDKGNMYGALAFYKACKEKGIHPIIGLEIETAVISNVTSSSGHLLLYAKNETGYANLLKLSTYIMRDTKGNSRAVPKEILYHHRDGLLAVSSGIEGEIQLLLNEDPQAIEETLSLYTDWFSDDFYIGIEDHGTGREKTINMELLSLSRRFHVPLAAMNETYYIDRSDAKAHHVLLCIKHGAKEKDSRKIALPTDEYYLKSSSEMEERFSHEIEAVHNTEKIAQKCQLDLQLGIPMLPRYPLPDGTSAHEFLKETCLEGAKQRYKEVKADVMERLEYELSIISRMHFEDYFLVVWDFMKFAHETGMITGPGRGSAAGSIVAYVLRITNVDPMKHGLLFERFLNPERISMPDIDIDFPDNRREEVLNYVADKYGADHVAQIITFGTLAAKAALRDAGRVMDTPNELVDKAAKLIPSRPGITLQDAMKESYGLEKAYKEIEEVKHLVDVAATLEGLPRHASTHAAGVVISSDPLHEHVPLQEGHGGIALTQFSMEWLEEAGLLKMDFLGLRNLSLIEEIITSVQNRTGISIHLDEIPFDDKKTFELLGAGDTTGVFQLESDGMRRVLQQLQPTEFEDIVAVNALYRPGPMQNIPVYIEGKHGKKQVSYLHEDLEPILSPTYGVIVYQEQIMQIASKAAGFSLGEADLLRRAVGKKKKDILLRERAHFVDGCLSNGYSKETADALYDLIVMFADYGFNRSHAVAYSIISYQLAYLKANYPQDFMSALLSSVIGNPDKLNAYIKESRSKGIAVLQPCVNRSGISFQAEGDAIRFGLLSIKNAGLQSIRHILEKSREKPFVDLFDLCARCSTKKVNKRTLESFIFAGAMDGFGKDRSVLLASLDSAMEYGEKVQALQAQEQYRLFGDKDTLPKPPYVEVPPLTENDKLAFEQEALGFFFSSHPIERHRPLLEDWNTYPVYQMGDVKTNQEIRMGAMIDKVRVIKTKKGDMMAFIGCSDETGETEAVAFPETYKLYHAVLQKGELLFVEGSVEKRNESVQLIIKKAMPLSKLPPKKASNERTLYVKFSSGRKDESIHAVAEKLSGSPGETAVILYDEQTGKKARFRHPVLADNQVIQALAAIVGEENVILKEK